MCDVSFGEPLLLKNSAGPRWDNAAILVGVLYFAIAVSTGALATMVESTRAQFLWRLSAFIFSGLLFLGHIAYEQVRLHSTPKSTAVHTSIAVAIGALVLAVSANMHDLFFAMGYRWRMLLALILWPILTAIPAFVSALILATATRKLIPGKSKL